MASQNDGKLSQYWDTCLFINFLKNDNAEKASIVNEGLQLARKNQLMIVVSSLVVAEVRPHDGGKYNYPDEDRQDEIEQLFSTNRSYIRVVGVSRPISLRSRSIAANLLKLGHDISVNDAVHLATAEMEGVDALLTWDGENTKPDVRRSRTLIPCSRLVGSPPLEIKMPQHDWGPLWKDAEPTSADPSSPYVPPSA